MFLNPEIILYKMFMSPIYSKEMRQGQGANLLTGNLFDSTMPEEVYSSLLGTLALKPKKKHLKKVIAHMEKYNYKPTRDQVAMIAQICMMEDWPILLGTTMKTFIDTGI
jgi:hypothetical protein